MERAACLYAAFETLGTQLHFNLSSADRDTLDRELIVVKESLGAPEFARAWQEGSSMFLDAVVSLALDRDPS